MLSLLEQVNINPGIWEMSSFQPQNSLPLCGMTAVLLYVSSGLCQPQALWHNIAGRGESGGGRWGLDHFDSPQNIMLDHYIDDIMLIGSTQEVASILDSLVKLMHSRGWEINPVNIQGPDAQMKFLGLQLSRAC